MRLRLVLALTLTALTMGAMASSQPLRTEDPVAIRIPVRSADPWMIKSLLEGLAVKSPEMSTMPGFQGLQQNAAGAAGAFLRSGKLMVNPTDNSLWYIGNRS